MPLEIKKLAKSEVEITGEVPADVFDKCWQKAIKKFSAEVTIPGFRPGNAPEKILIEKISEGVILERAAEIAIQEAYPEIVKEHKLDVIGPPRASITKIAKSSPLGFKIRASLLPEIKLAENLKDIAGRVMKIKEEANVEEKEIDASLEQLRKMRTKEGAPLPELNDDFAKSVGKFNGLLDLRGAIRENLKYEKEARLKEKKRLEILEEIIKASEMEIPDILIEAEKAKMLEEFKNNITGFGLKWEDYLAHLKKKEEEILEGWAGDALKRVKYGLTLRQLADDLKIEVTDKEIEEKITTFHIHDDEKAEIDHDRLKDYAYGIIRNDKVFLRLMAD